MMILWYNKNGLNRCYQHLFSPYQNRTILEVSPAMADKIIRSQVVKLNPTHEQEQYFYRAAGVARFVWNWGLAEYQAAKDAGEKVDWNNIQKKFNSIKRDEYPFVVEVTKSASQIAFADLRQAINTYYQIKKADEKSKMKFPGRRRRSRKVGGFGIQNNQFTIDGHTVRIPRLGNVNISHPLRFNGRILSGRVKEKAGRWYLTVTVETEADPKPFLSGSIGVDFGLSSFATLSDGEVVETQAYFRKSERKLVSLQRGLSRKQKGSKRRDAHKLRIARHNERIANQRKDFLHKFTKGLTSSYKVICIEDLNLSGLCQSWLAKSVSDAGIGDAVKMLEYKSLSIGGILQKVNRFFPSSKMCSFCGWKYKDLRLSDRQWTCPECLTSHHRDVNAAVNIKEEGLRLLAGTGWVGLYVRGEQGSGLDANGLSETSNRRSGKSLRMDLQH